MLLIAAILSAGKLFELQLNAFRTVWFCASRSLSINVPALFLTFPK